MLEIRVNRRIEVTNLSAQIAEEHGECDDSDEEHGAEKRQPHAEQVRDLTDELARCRTALAALSEDSLLDDPRGTRADVLRRAELERLSHAADSLGLLLAASVCAREFIPLPWSKCKLRASCILHKSRIHIRANANVLLRMRES